MKNKLKKFLIKGNLSQRVKANTEKAILEDKMRRATDIAEDEEYKDIYEKELEAIFSQEDCGYAGHEFIIKSLQEANAKGKNVYAWCTSGKTNIKLYSVNVAMDEAFKKLEGCTRDEYIAKEKARYGEDYYIKRKARWAKAESQEMEK